MFILSVNKIIIIYFYQKVISRKKRKINFSTYHISKTFYYLLIKYIFLNVEQTYSTKLFFITPRFYFTISVNIELNHIQIYLLFWFWYISLRLYLCKKQYKCRLRAKWPSLCKAKCDFSIISFIRDVTDYFL